MLVLTRKEGEGIDIGGIIKVVILSVNKGKIRVGIDAPKEVLILRSELDEALGESDG